METDKNRDEPSDNTTAAEQRNTSKEKEAALKDLTPQTDATQHVKGGIPKQPTNTGGDV